MKNFYITTAIAYVNAPPHVGFALELCHADAIARWRRLWGDTVLYLTGTDEHGQKIQKAADAAGKAPDVFVDEISEHFRTLTRKLNISNDDFIRTSDAKRHWPGASLLWKTLSQKGALYKKDYEGLYCDGCEAFKAPSDLVDGVCPDHKRAPEIIKEENYFFKLSEYETKLNALYEEGAIRIVPDHRRSEVLNFIRQGLEDISFSRPRKDLSWGIPVPDDDSHTMYVWADALVNYISALGFGGADTERFRTFWPADVHVIGKDILRFHAIIWPAMLLAAGLPLPKNILVHGHIQSGGQKMSKSLGNVIDPFELISRYGADAVRYFLLKEIPATEDGDMTAERMGEVYSSELANGLGNLVARVTTIAEKHGSEHAFVPEAFGDIIADAWRAYEDAMGSYNFSETLQRVYALVREGNLYVERERPWEEDNWKRSIPNLLYLIANVSWMAQPFIPETAGKIFAQLGIDTASKESWGGKTFRIRRGEPLFPRVQ